jgi:hypothetical protein
VQQPVQAARAGTAEAVEFYRTLAADNPAHTPGLATSLNNLGDRLSQLGRPAEGLPPTDEAVQLRRRLAADNPAHLFKRPTRGGPTPGCPDGGSRSHGVFATLSPAGVSL